MPGGSCVFARVAMRRAVATVGSPALLARAQMQPGEGVQWRDAAGAVTSHAIRHVFLMTGAEANTAWLNRCVALDDKGFVKTGQDLTPDDLQAAQWPLGRSPYLFETSRPGVFAVGDVRCGNIKRVASAVGEGSNAVSLVHRVLADESSLTIPP